MHLSSLTAIVSMAGILSIGACNAPSSEVKKRQRVIPEEDTTDSTEAPSPGDNAASKAPEPQEGGKEQPSLELCNQKYGKAYQAIPAACLEDMVKWECCEEKVLARFAAFADVTKALQAKFASYGEESFSLYNCEARAEDLTVLHFWRKADGFVERTREIKVNGTPAEVDDSQITCSQPGSKPPTNPDSYQPPATETPVDPYEPKSDDGLPQTDDTDPEADADAEESTPPASP